jgi:hypothetical protein
MRLGPPDEPIHPYFWSPPKRLAEDEAEFHQPGANATRAPCIGGRDRRATLGEDVTYLRENPAPPHDR